MPLLQATTHTLYLTMTGFFKSVFGPSLGTSGRAPSFNDFSLHVADDGAPSFLMLPRNSVPCPCNPSRFPDLHNLVSFMHQQRNPFEGL